MIRRRYLGATAALLSGGYAAGGLVGTPTSDPDAPGSVAAGGRGGCRSRFRVETRPFTPEALTVTGSLDDEGRALVSEAVEGGVAERLASGDPALESGVYVEYDGAFYEVSRSVVRASVPAYRLDVTWTRGRRPPDNATRVAFSALPSADRTALALRGREGERVDWFGDGVGDDLPRKSVGVYDFPAPYPRGGEPSRVVNGGVVWVEWDGRAYRVDAGASTTTERRVRRYTADRVDGRGVRAALASSAVRLDRLPPREHGIVERAVDGEYRECAPASDALRRLLTRLPDDARLPIPARSWSVRFESELRLLRVTRWERPGG